MKKYSKTYQLTHDIDWFCIIGNTPMHFASNCGLLPNKVNNKDANRRIQEQVSLMDNVVESIEHIVINREYIRARLSDNMAEDGYDNYLRSFVEMAMKGFVSFDRDVERDDTYVWIAKPDSAVAVPIEEIPTYEEGVCRIWALNGEKVHVRCLNANN